MKDITDRIHRVTGQLESLELAIVAEKDCSAVIPQLLAVKGAIDAVVHAYMEQSLNRCIDDADAAKLKQVVKTLIKHS